MQSTDGSRLVYLNLGGVVATASGARGVCNFLRSPLPPLLEFRFISDFYNQRSTSFSEEWG